MTRPTNYLLVLTVLLGIGFWAGPAPAAPPAGYGMVFDEEFNGTSIYDTKFGYQWSGYEGTNDTMAGVSVGGGNLTLTSYTTNDGGVLSNWGGCVATNGYNEWGGYTNPKTGDPMSDFQYTYGYIEARIKFSNAPGNVQAFWLESDRMFDSDQPKSASYGNEVDIIEHRQTDSNNNNIPTTDHMAIHWGGYNTSGSKQVTANSTISGLDSGFHTFGLLWTSTDYKFYVDGVLKETMTPSHSNPFMSNGPEWIVLDSNPTGGWSGTIPPAGYGDLATSTTTMTVDYVRVYQAGVVPEPATLVLFGVGAVGLLAYAWRRRRA